MSKAHDLAFEFAKQLVALALGGIAFAIGITNQDAEALRHSLFWWSVGGFAASAFFGYLFLMHGISSYSQGVALDLYVGQARALPILQIVALALATALLLKFHLDSVERKSQVSDTKLTLQHAGKETAFVLPPGKSITIVILPTGEAKAEIK